MKEMGRTQLGSIARKEDSEEKLARVEGVKNGGTHSVNFKLFWKEMGVWNGVLSCGYVVVEVEDSKQ